MQTEMIKRLSKPVPRYTSYPTAPHFHADINASTYRDWLSDIPARTKTSLYLHIPFCDRLCWFCGCATKQVRRYDPVETYLQALTCEIGNVGELVTDRSTIHSLHFGGGSPTMLKAADILMLGKVLRNSFMFSDRAEISVEMDPNDMTGDRFDAFADIGMTRASLGVQDFDSRVQQAINREQSFAQTAFVVEQVRKRNVQSVNLDVLYGLPHQTIGSIEKTILSCLQLDPDRIALFGYAHVPWIKKHQTMIDEAVLPDAIERYRQQEHAVALLKDAGYIPVGFDHFAKPDDSMARAVRKNSLKRNFQGYTTDNATALIGLGASAIGQLENGYIQNSPASADYQRRIEKNGLATIRGRAVNGDDRMRRAVIEKLMCDFSFRQDWLLDTFGSQGTEILTEAETLIKNDRDGLFTKDGDTFQVTKTGRPFVRVIASHFDAYLEQGMARYSSAV